METLNIADMKTITILTQLTTLAATMRRKHDPESPKTPEDDNYRDFHGNL
jgi:hypothetical protein